MEALKRLVGRVGAAIPNNLAVFVAAIFLTYGVTTFATIYAVPGHPMHSFGLWVAFSSSLIAAALWTCLAAKKDAIDKAILSDVGDLNAREAERTRMWREVWLRTLIYFGGAAAFSTLALLALVVP